MLKCVGELFTGVIYPPQCRKFDVSLACLDMKTSSNLDCFSDKEDNLVTEKSLTVLLYFALFKF